MATEPDAGAPATEEPKGIPAVNSPFDAPTIFADTVQGLMFSSSILKVFFLEHLNPIEDAELRGRYVLNLTMPAGQLRAMGDLFTKLANEYETTVSGES